METLREKKVKTWKENKWRNKEKKDDNKKQNQVENGIGKKKTKRNKKHPTNDQTMERAKTETDTMKKTFDVYLLENHKDLFDYDSLLTICVISRTCIEAELHVHWVS
jgi:hypothetical protein